MPRMCAQHVVKHWHVLHTQQTSAWLHIFLCKLGSDVWTSYCRSCGAQVCMPRCHNVPVVVVLRFVYRLPRTWREGCSLLARQPAIAIQRRCTARMTQACVRCVLFQYCSNILQYSSKCARTSTGMRHLLCSSCFVQRKLKLATLECSQVQCYVLFSDTVLQSCEHAGSQS